MHGTAQATVQPAIREDGARPTARGYIDGARKLLRAVGVPGVIELDEGGLQGWDISTTKMPFGTGTTETEVLKIYPPWLKASWEEAGKRCLFYFGILPPQPKRFMEDHMHHWDVGLMRSGLVVFTPTPEGLETW